MRKKVLCLFGIIISACILFSSCGKNLPNTYVEGSDYQYMQVGSMDFASHKQKGENGYYFLFNNYIYYLDEETDTLLPLCNKADCLHDKETDPEKYDDCNAYAGKYYDASSDSGIAYCNGYIYYYYESMSGPSTLYRISADGSKREEIYQWDEDISVAYWIIHRDVLYYKEVAYSFAVSSDGVNTTGVEDEVSIKALPLTGLIHEPETIYTMDKSLDEADLAWPMAYGNYLYFEVYFEGEDSGYSREFVYDITEKQFSQLTIPNMSEQISISGVSFWQDKVIFQPYDSSEQGKVYIADLNGSNVEVFMENIPQRYVFQSDGKYLYLINSIAVELGDEDEAVYKVYDSELNLVDTIKLGYEFSGGYNAVGDADRQYMFYYKEDDLETTYHLEYWDKSEIGSYNGKVIEFTNIPDR